MSTAGLRCFCRDCLRDLDFTARRCAHCGSPRLVRHHALPDLTIAHIDCDAFYATVEKRDNPVLADRPVVIGGGKRGVVSAACYIARTYGVRSAMPMFKALALCPDATVIRPDMAKYARIGREVRQAMHALTPLVEPLSIDEAFLDLGGTQAVHGAIPAKVLARFATQVERDIGITVSVGLSCNKFLAKIASDLDKPRGFATLDQDDGRALLADKPVGFIFGVGPATQERLAQRGFRTVADMQRADEIDLMRQFPTDGRRLWRLARGGIPERGARNARWERAFRVGTPPAASARRPGPSVAAAIWPNSGDDPVRRLLPLRPCAPNGNSLIAAGHRRERPALDELDDKDSHHMAAGSEGGVPRRQVVRGAAWSVPAIVAASALPAHAASIACVWRKKSTTTRPARTWWWTS